MHALELRPLDAGRAVQEVSTDRDGAVVTFLGTVRATSHGRRVLRLEYEAHERMALETFARIAEEASRIGGAQVAIHHRLGECAPGELSVVVAAAAPHRAEAFQACRYAIDQVKARAEIWKREVTESGAEWVEGS